MLDRDRLGAGSLLSNLALQETSKLLLLFEVLDTFSDKDLSLANNLGKSQASSSLSLE